MNTTEYYYDFDRYVASIDRGSKGFFVRQGNDKNTKWEFVIPGSRRWDSLHQNIYFAHHDYDSCPKDIVDTLPELPPVPTFKKMEWKDNFLPLGKMLVEDFPFLSKKIYENHGEMIFWIVLNEDLYETFFGDGKFLYFNGEVFNSEKEVVSRIKNEEEASRNAEYPWTGHMSILVKKIRLGLQGGRIITYDSYPDVFEHFSIEKVLGRIEEIIASKCDDGWGKEDKSKVY